MWTGHNKGSPGAGFLGRRTTFFLTQFLIQVQRGLVEVQEEGLPEVAAAPTPYSYSIQTSDTTLHTWSCRLLVHHL